MFSFSPKTKILDLGCGDGLNIKLLKEMGVEDIIGVDISRYLLKKARALNPDIQFVLASAENLPFNNNEFDVVLADSVLHHLIHRTDALTEINRVLKKSGKFCFIDPHQSFLRKLLDWITLSTASRFIPFLSSRREAYLAERDLINDWLNSEKEFLMSIPKYGFRKKFLKADLFSLIGEYRKK